MVFSIEKSPLVPSELIKLDNTIKKNKSKKRGKLNPSNQSSTNHISSPNISKMYSKISSIHNEQKYQTQKMKDVSYYRELLKRMDLKTGNIMNPALKLTSKDKQERRTSNKIPKNMKYSNKKFSKSKERKCKRAKSSKNYQLSKIKSEASIKLGMELSTLNSNKKRDTKVENVREILSNRIMDKEDMKVSICNSQLIISNKKKSFNNSKVNEKSKKNYKNFVLKEKFETFRKNPNKLESYKKEILKEISNQLGEKEFNEMIKVSNVIKSKKKSQKASAKRLLQNKDFRDKLISSTKMSQLLSNRSKHKKSKVKSSGNANFMMAETGSNPSTSNLSQINNPNQYPSQLPSDKVLKSSSGVGTRLHKRSQRSLNRKRFDISQKKPSN